jgi:CBS domain-containing protein
MARDRRLDADRAEVEEYNDEAYFDRSGIPQERSFDTRLLREPTTVLPVRKPLVLSRFHSVTDAIRAMQSEHRGVVVVTEDGTCHSRVVGIFTERDVLFRIVDQGRNPATLPLGDLMTAEPECLRDDQTIADVLQMMSVGGFRHVPIVDADGRPVHVVSVRDVVEFLVEAFPREVLNRGSDRTSEREGG